MTTKHFSHADKTREYIMAYLLSLPSSVEKSTRAITEVVEENMRRDGLKPARSIGYLMRELERFGKVSKRGQQFWKAVRTPIEDGYSREQAESALKKCLQQIQAATDFATDACGTLTDVLDELFKVQSAEQRLGFESDFIAQAHTTALIHGIEKKMAETPQADDSGDKPADIKVDE